MDQNHLLDHEPRELGSLHDRMSLVIRLARTLREECGKSGENLRLSDSITNAVLDLATIVACLPDVAFHSRTDKIVPADRRGSKRGFAVEIGANGYMADHSSTKIKKEESHGEDRP